jgi:hypothetical protein
MDTTIRMLIGMGMGDESIDPREVVRRIADS